jgi:2-methylisocitrate lyase-like PEP mutase family enzyme
MSTTTCAACDDKLDASAKKVKIGNKAVAVCSDECGQKLTAAEASAKKDTMADQKGKAELFRALHVPGKPVVLFNIWDPGSAKAVAAAGAKALATGSWSVANVNGYADGEHLPLDLAIDNLRRIVSVTSLPVTIDLESGYGDAPQVAAETIRRAITAGAIGCNLEDSFPANGRLRTVSDQSARIRAARTVAEEAGVRFFLNARTDVFFQGPAKQHNDAMVAEALERARAYAEAGASGIFVPGLSNPTLITAVVKGSPLPVNIMVNDLTPPLAELAKLGVARVSFGPRPYLTLMKSLEEAARAAGV